MKTLEKTNYQLASELNSKAETFVDREFNFINVNVYEKCLDNMLFEHIRSNSDSIKVDFIKYDCNEIDDLLKAYVSDTQNEIEEGISLTEDINFLDWLDNNDEFIDYRDSKNDENYPMWNTLFEFKHEPSEEVIELAQKAGFGVIESTDYFNTTLFVCGAGYSFFAAHWIPLWLSLPWNDNGREDYKDIDFSMV